MSLNVENLPQGSHLITTEEAWRPAHVTHTFHMLDWSGASEDSAHSLASRGRARRGARGRRTFKLTMHWEEQTTP